MLQTLKNAKALMRKSLEKSGKCPKTNPTIKFYARDCCTSDYGNEVHIMIGETSNKEQAADCGSISSIIASSTRTTTCTGSGQYV